MLPPFVNPDVAYLCRGKTRKSAFRRRRTAHRLGQVEAYLNVREVLSEASTAADDVLSREPSGFYRCRYATLGLNLKIFASISARYAMNILTLLAEVGTVDDFDGETRSGDNCGASKGVNLLMHNHFKFTDVFFQLLYVSHGKLQANV